MQIHHITLKSKIEDKFFHLAIGNFDGVHLGHQQIIKELVQNANNNGKPSAILSFEPHPRQYFSRNLDRYQIISKNKKEEIIKNLGVNNLFFLNFNESIANLSPSDFIKNIIIDQLQVRKLVVGYDFKFGKNREGDISLLKNYATIYGFDLDIVEPIKDNFNNTVYSSSVIREFIKNGDMENASKILGYSWIMEGEIIHGDKRARKMNFPTANILPHNQIYPLKGVYAIKASVGKKIFKGIANFGERPTVNGKKLLLEVHFFDFNEDIYGKQLTVEFLTFIRGEKKFDSFSFLVEQIKKDIQITKDYHLSK